jgi:hypothetical protein
MTMNHPILTRTSSLLPLVVLTALFGCTPYQPATREEMNHEFILRFPGVSKDRAFDKTLKWIALNFRSAKAVIEYQDKELGTIVGNGSSEFIVGGDLPRREDIIFTMDIEFKEERARIRFTNLQTNGINHPWEYFPVPDFAIWHRPARLAFVDIVYRLEAYINAKTDPF